MFNFFSCLVFLHLHTQTSNILVDSPSGTGVLYFLGCFFSILQVWLNKTSYDARFVNSGDDFIHRIWEVAYLTTLASTIIHIHPVHIMATTTTYQAMFAFAMSLVVGQVLFLLRYVELYYLGLGQRDVLKRLAKTEGLVLLVGLLFQVIAAIVAGMDYFRTTMPSTDDDGDVVDGHRWLASSSITTIIGNDINYTTTPINNNSNTSSSSSSYGGEDRGYDDEYNGGNDPSPNFNTVPIWLCLIVPVLYWVYRVMENIFFFPNDGYSHKQFGT
jgi:hypothetical protein